MADETNTRGATESHPAAKPVMAPSVAAIRRVNAQDLLGANREVIVTLQDTEYRLRLTSKGKLILTK